MSNWNQPPPGGQPPWNPGAPNPAAGAPQAAAPGAPPHQPVPQQPLPPQGAMLPVGPAAMPPPQQPMAPQGAMVPVGPAAMAAPMAAAPQAAPAAPLAFKFTLARAPAFSARSGVAAPHQLELEGMALPYACIADTETRDANLVLMVSDAHMLDPTLQTWVEEDGFLVLTARGPTAREIEAAIDRFASWFAAERRRAELAAAGREAEFRTLPCPKCGATIDLSCTPASQYAYCRFCLSVFQPNSPQAESDDYRTCDECGMFDRVKGYTEFYFYFLIIVYGFSSKRRHMCDTCAGGLFWKTFLINFLFLLGVPSAIWIKIKSLRGRDPELNLLAEANKLARKGRMQEAGPIFQQLHQRYPSHPGLLMNEARGHIEADDPHTAMSRLETALQSCPNYLPAFELMEILAAAPQPGLPPQPGYG